MIVNVANVPPKASTALSSGAFLVLDTESVPDGKLIAKVKYPEAVLTPEEAIERAQQEARERSLSGSDFLPVTFQIPVAVCVLRAGSDFRIQALTCLDAPHFRPREMVHSFWRGVESYPKAKMVSFNGRGFDLPLLELAAFRFGCSGRNFFQSTRGRYGGNHLDLMDWLSNFGAYRLAGGLDLLSKILGKPGKMNVSGDQVYQMYRAGRLQDINDYCMFDTLDTYFVFLRTRVLNGDLTLEGEHEVVVHAKTWLQTQTTQLPGLNQYLNNWGDWEPWP